MMLTNKDIRFVFNRVKATVSNPLRNYTLSICKGDIDGKVSVCVTKFPLDHTIQCHIRVGQNFKEICLNKDELAIVLGHELGHTINPKNRSYPYKEVFIPYVIQNEIEADLIGFELARKAGYNVRHGILINLRTFTAEWKKDRYDAILNYYNAL